MFARGAIGVAVLVLTGAIAGGARAQLKESTDATGDLPWIVTKVNHEDFTGKSDSVVSKFATEDEAKADAKKRNEGERSKWTHAYSRKKDAPRPVEQSDESPKLPQVKARGAIEVNGEKGNKAPALAGKVGTGTIGNSKVTIKFGDKSDEVVISGDVKGEGKFKQIGQGVLFETADARYRGKFDGKKATGVRLAKEGTEQLVEWTIAFDGADPKQPARPTPGKDIKEPPK
jgi:hypothetical protein